MFRVYLSLSCELAKIPPLRTFDWAQKPFSTCASFPLIESLLRAFILLLLSQAVEVSRQRLSKIQGSNDGDLQQRALPKLPPDSPGKNRKRRRFVLQRLLTTAILFH